MNGVKSTHLVTSGWTLHYLPDMFASTLLHTGGNNWYVITIVMDREKQIMHDYHNYVKQLSLL